MKKLVSVIIAMLLCLSLCACGGGSDLSESFKVDGAYYSEADLSQFATYGTDGMTEEEFFEINPHLRESYMTDNDEIWILVFASLSSLEEGEEDLILPQSEYHESIPGNVLPLELHISDEIVCSTNYEINNTNGRFNGLWDDYKSGKDLDTDYVLYAGSNDSVKIVGAFYMKYHDYRIAKEEGQEWTLTWGDYKTVFNASDIEKKGSIYSISDAINQ